MVFRTGGYERVVVIAGIDRMLRTTQWTRASTADRLKYFLGVFVVFVSLVSALALFLGLVW